MEVSFCATYRPLCAPSVGSCKGECRAVRAEVRSAQSFGKFPLWPQPTSGFAFASSASAFSAWPAERLSSSSEASFRIIEAADTAVSGAAGFSISPAVQLSAENAANLASAESVEGAASQAIQSSVGNAGDAGSSSINAVTGSSGLLVNILGTSAFVALILLTIGVVYLVVSDFLEKRKNDQEIKRLNEEEATSRKKQGGARSLMTSSRGGAKGFGRKRPIADDDDGEQ